MKRIIILATMFVAMIAYVQTAQAQNTATASFNLSMTVDKYIETTASPLEFDFGTTRSNVYYGAPRNEDLYDGWGNAGEWNLAYANCPFSVTLSGDNPASQGVPRFARAEVGAHAGPADFLNTSFRIGFLTNGGVENDAFGYVWGIGASSFPKTASFDEAPHNGQIKMNMQAAVNSHWMPANDVGIPIRNTVIDASMTNDQSADAGKYSCTMLVTLTAL